MKLKDDDPMWEQHSGGDGHSGPEWGSGDVSRAADFYRSLTDNARLVFDPLMERPGEQVNSDRIAAQIRGRDRGREPRARPGRSVTGSLSVTG